jgi:polyferredoxin
MERIDRPAGLIRYDSLARLAGERTHIVRPRVLVYSVLLVGVAVALFVGLSIRPHVDFTVVRPPGEPYMVLPGGVISNHFTLVLHNRAQSGKVVRITADGPPATRIIVPVNPLNLGADEETRTEAFVNVPADEVKSGKAPVRIRVYEGKRPVAEQSMTFLAPEHE